MNYSAKELAIMDAHSARIKLINFHGKCSCTVKA